MALVFSSEICKILKNCFIEYHWLATSELFSSCFYKTFFVLFVRALREKKMNAKYTLHNETSKLIRKVNQLTGFFITLLARLLVYAT